MLDAVKRERRVAWMLLSHATVQSLEDGVLTVRFAREGDRKGFTSSDRGADLSRVLAREFGMNVQVKATSAASAPSAVSSAGLREPGGRGSVPDPVPSRPGDPDRTTSARAAASQPESVVPAPEGDPFDAADPESSVPEPGLTGMDLIRRELGGEIIDEIDHG